MSGNSTISNVTPAIGAVKIQQSTYGLAIPIMWGRTRLTGNLIWYGDFRAIPHTEVTQSGGKGGGGVRQENTSFTYTASVMMALGFGPYLGIRTVWRGKSVFTGSTYGGATVKTSEYLVVAANGTATATNRNGWMNVSAERQLGADLADDFRLYRRRAMYPLVEGVDYTAVNGIYTFAGGEAGPGDMVRLTYTYTSTDPGVSCLGKIGLELAKGHPGQAPWSYLATNHPDQAAGYSGIAYVAGANYSLGSGAEVENHSFEVDGPLQFSSTIPDARPADIAVDALSNPQYGARFGAEKIGDMTDYAAACTAQGIFLSPALTEQTTAAQFLETLASLTNVGLVWSNGTLKFVPYADAQMTGNGVTYTPNTAPIYDLTDDDFLPGDSDGPVKVVRAAPADSYNSVKLEYLDRANGYNIAIMPADDQADIQEFGLRQMATVTAHWICDAKVAKIVATLILQRSMFIRNTYEFKLGWTKIALEPMDIVTLTDPGLGLAKLPVRIVSIDEDGEGELAIVAEDFPIGSATATLYPTTTGTGFAHNFNESPGAVLDPVIFEAPVALASQEGGLELWLAAGGTDAKYGGCEVWVSLTGDNYQRAASLVGSSRYGKTTTTLAAASSGATTMDTVGVQLLAGGQLLSGAAADRAQLTTLCYVDGEFIAYETATLTGQGAYTIGAQLARGAYLSAAAAHGAGVAFVRCDEALAKISLSTDYIGKTVYVKLLPFNHYGGGLGDLASAKEYSYTIIGAQATNSAKAVADAAKAAIDAISSDSVLAKGEKAQVVLDWNVILGEKSGLDAQADALAVSRTSYDNAYTALYTYLTGLVPSYSDTTTDTAIVGATFRTKFSDYYGAKQALINAMAAKAAQTAQWPNIGGAGKPQDNATADFSPFKTWDFRSTLDGWAAGGTATATLGSDSITLSSNGADPMLTIAGLAFAGGLYDKLRLRVRRKAGAGWQGQLYYSTASHSATEVYSKIVGIDPTAGGAWTIIEWDMSSIADWTGSTITALRLDLGTTTTDQFEIDWITVGKYGVGSDELSAAAAAAKSAADEANAAIANISSDNVLSKGEKPSAYQQWLVIYNEYDALVAKFRSLGIADSDTPYIANYGALVTYLNGVSSNPGWLSDFTTDTPIDGPTFRQKFTDYYTAKQALLNAMSAKAATMADASGLNVTIGGDNLAYNSSFDRWTNGQTGYNIYNNAGAAEPTGASQAAGRLGGSSILIEWTGSHTSSKGIYGAMCKGGWQPGKTYIISFYARSTNISGNPNFFVAWNKPPVSQVDLLNPPLVGTGWSRYAFRIKWGTDVTNIEDGGVAFISVATGSGSGNVYFDDLMVVEGDVLPSYYPSTAEAAEIAQTASDTLSGKPAIAAISNVNTGIGATGTVTTLATITPVVTGGKGTIRLSWVTQYVSTTGLGISMTLNAGSTTATFKASTRTSGQDASMNVTVTATDDAGLTASQTFNIYCDAT